MQRCHVTTEPIDEIGSVGNPPMAPYFRGILTTSSLAKYVNIAINVAFNFTSSKLILSKVSRFVCQVYVS